ncbi:hypothetical protein [Niallia sp. 01092]|uniref:hypothetical protein n=1 Tax=unclassified Niallia TaxID=2837522 RepID=UPI003FD44BD5
MDIAKAKKEIVKLKQEIELLEQFICLAESYQPASFEQEVIKQYAFRDNITEVAKRLDCKGDRNNTVKKLIPAHISEIIKSEPKDELHRIVRTFFYKNKRGRNQSYYSNFT